MISCILLNVVSIAHGQTAPTKQKSVFYPSRFTKTAAENAERFDWARDARRRLVSAAGRWMDMSQDELWNLMFGNTITRSWMVWSNGHCPSCKVSVPMYTWKMEPFKHPWKVRCPHCGDLFPKNDFHKFYLSGLDEHGVFDPKLADRSLLFNAEHPDPDDPLHLFGVDDGEGYVDGENRWRFIGAYLIYAQWKHVVLNGISSLAAAYTATGNVAYARRAGILLDRVADLYPTFDFAKQGVVYEAPGQAGYVSTWHDACEEALLLALAYDQVFEGIKHDPGLVDFLAAKAKQYKLENPKTSFEDIQRNIEDRILRDTLANRPKIESNYPRTDAAIVTAMAVLGWPGNRQEVYAHLDPVIARATAVDGVTGEKGLAAYSAGTIQGLASLLARLDQIDDHLLKDMLDRHPALRWTFRFHIDTLCLGRYYPQSGDSGQFAAPTDRYVGAPFSRTPGIHPSSFGLFWKLYELTGDPVFVQILYRANQDSVEGLPYDILAEDPGAFQKQVQDVIDREGAEPKLSSVNKQQWHLAVLRSGVGESARALWLDYDSGGGHGHADGMNLGLFARGLDLMPEFGYPPVQYGGWGSPRAAWFRSSACHNTVVVDGRNHSPGGGSTTLWADGKAFHAVRASAPELVSGEQFERTAALIDISDSDFYVLDIFRVVGGTDHAKFMHSHFGKISTSGLALQPSDDYAHETIMRNFHCDAAPEPGWSVDWTVEDRQKLLPDGSQVHVRYTDLTSNVRAACTAEGWLTTSGFNSNEETWIPRVMVRRQCAQEPLASTFVSIVEPYGVQSNIARIKRVPIETPDGDPYSDSTAAVEVHLADGRRDLLIAADVENPLHAGPALEECGWLVQKDWGVRLRGEMCLVRLAPNGELDTVAVCRGKSISVGSVQVELADETEFAELRFPGGRAVVESGGVRAVLVDGKDILQR